MTSTWQQKDEARQRILKVYSQFMESRQLDAQALLMSLVENVCGMMSTKKINAWAEELEKLNGGR